jgi:hypothetical protein
MRGFSLLRVSLRVKQQLKALQSQVSVVAVVR